MGPQNSLHIVREYREDVLPRRNYFLDGMQEGGDPNLGNNSCIWVSGILGCRRSVEAEDLDRMLGVQPPPLDSEDIYCLGDPYKPQAGQDLKMSNYLPLVAQRLTVYLVDGTWSLDVPWDKPVAPARIECWMPNSQLFI
jgi:hypothetical protein